MQSYEIVCVPSRLSKMTLWIAGGFLCGALLLPGCGTKKESVAPPPPTVEVAEVGQKDVPLYHEWVGTMDGSVNAVIKAQVSGYLIKQNYREGEVVKKGQALFEIDPRIFQAVVDQAKGALDQARGELARQEASSATTRADLARIKPLAARNAVSQKDLDDAVGKELASRAAVDAARAGIATARANLDKATLDLGFTRITSPVDGIAGIAKSQIGNLVGPGSQQELTTVSNLNPIKVYINLSEQEYLRVHKTGNNPAKMELELILTDGSVYPHKGRFSVADRQIDPTTGTLKVGSLFPNPGNLLRPGQFGKVRALTSTQKGALLVPQRAVTEMQGKYLIAVVGTDNKVDIRQVTVGERIGSDWLITAGIKPGEQVVAEGTQKVRPGSAVNPKPFAPASTTTGSAEKTAATPAGKR